MMVKDNVRKFAPSLEAERYALMTEQQQRDCFQAFRPVQQAFTKVETEVEVFLKNKEPVPSALMESLNEKRRIRDRLRNPLMVANMRLVFSVCTEYQGRGVDYLDIVQEATLGLMTAVERFEPEFGNKFSTYATWWIRGYAREIVKQRLVHIPYSRMSDENTLSRDLESFRLKHGRAPSDEELRAFTKHSTITELNGKQMRSFRENPTAGVTLSLDAPVSGEGTLSFVSQLQSPAPNPEALLIAKKRLARLQKEILKIVSVSDRRKSHNERDDEIIRTRYGLNPSMSPMALKETGDLFGITRERVRQIVDERLAYHGLIKEEFEAKLKDMVILYEALTNAD